MAISLFIWEQDQFNVILKNESDGRKRHCQWYFCTLLIDRYMTVWQCICLLPLHTILLWNCRTKHRVWNEILGWWPPRITSLSVKDVCRMSKPCKTNYLPYSAQQSFLLSFEWTYSKPLDTEHFIRCLRGNTWSAQIYIIPSIKLK